MLFFVLCGLGLGARDYRRSWVTYAENCPEIPLISLYPCRKSIVLYQQCKIQDCQGSEVMKSRTIYLHLYQVSSFLFSMPRGLGLVDSNWDNNRCRSLKLTSSIADQLSSEIVQITALFKQITALLCYLGGIGKIDSLHSYGHISLFTFVVFFGTT